MDPTTRSTTSTAEIRPTSRRAHDKFVAALRRTAWVAVIPGLPLMAGGKSPVRHAVVGDRIVGFHIGALQLRWNVQSEQCAPRSDTQVELDARAAALVKGGATAKNGFAEGVNIEGVFGSADTVRGLAQMADGTSWFGPRAAAWVRTASGLSGYFVDSDAWLVCRSSTTRFPCEYQSRGRLEAWLREQSSKSPPDAPRGTRVLALSSVPGAPKVNSGSPPPRVILRRVDNATEVQLTGPHGTYRIRVDDTLQVLSAEFAAGLQGPTQEEDPSFLGRGR